MGYKTVITFLINLFILYNIESAAEMIIYC